MSAGKIIVDQVQIGNDAVATRNLVIQTNADGSFKIARGNVGATTQDILTIDSVGMVRIFNNGPMFAAWASTTTSLPNSTSTKIAYATEEVDSASCFDTATSRFQPNVAGWYWLRGTWSQNAVSANSTSIQRASIYKNGTELIRRDWQASVSTVPIPVVDGIAFLNGSTDYVEIFGFQNQGAGATVSAAQILNRFEGFLVRPQ